MGNEWEWVGTRRDGAEGKPRNRPCLLQGSSKEYLSSSRNRAGQGTLGVQCHWKRRSLDISWALQLEPEEGLLQGASLERATKLSLKQGRRKGCASGGGRWRWRPGEMARKEQGPSVGLEWGILAAPVGGGVLSACQVFAAAWEKPSPEILIQGRNRTGFSTGSWQCQGARGRKKPRGQEGSGRPEAETGGSDGALTFVQQSHHRCWGLRRHCVHVLFAGD